MDEPVQFEVVKPQKLEERVWHYAGKYIVQNRAGEFRSLAKDDFRTYAQTQGYKDFIPKEETSDRLVSEVKECMQEILLNRSVDYFGPVAGWMKGYYDHQGHSLMVSESPKSVEPAKPCDEWQKKELRALRSKFPDAPVESFEALEKVIESDNGAAPGWPVLNSFFTTLFYKEEDANSHEQKERIFGWIAETIAQLRVGVDPRMGPTQSLALFVPGEQGAGKTLFSKLVRVLFGGRRAYPYHYLTGQSRFNNELFSAVLQLIDDQPDRTDIKARHHFAQGLKQMIVGEASRAEAKFGEALELSALWRLLVLCNVDQDSLRVLPPLDLVADKVLLVKAFKGRLPMPTETGMQKAVFWAALMHELPYLCQHLLYDFKLPGHLGPTSRFPVSPWQHPELVELMEDLAPWTELWASINTMLLQNKAAGPFQHDGRILPMHTWVGSADELSKALRKIAPDFELTPVEIQRFSARGIGRHLATASERWPDRVIFRKTNKHGRMWYLSSAGWSDDEIKNIVGGMT